jgi:hypothetical protein
LDTNVRFELCISPYTQWEEMFPYMAFISIRKQGGFSPRKDKNHDSPRRQRVGSLSDMLQLLHKLEKHGNFSFVGFVQV